MKEFKSILVKDKKQMNKNKNKKIQFLDKKCNNIPLTMKLNEFTADYRDAFLDMANKYVRRGKTSE